MKKKEYLKRLAVQKLLGLALLLLCAIIVAIAVNSSPNDRDCTAILFLGPLGLYLLFTKKLYIA